MAVRYLKVISPPIREFEVCSNSGSPMQVIRPFVPTDASRRSGAGDGHVGLGGGIDTHGHHFDSGSVHLGPWKHSDPSNGPCPSDHDALARHIHLKILHIKRAR